MELEFKRLSSLLPQSHFIFLSREDDSLWSERGHSAQGSLSAERGHPLLDSSEHAGQALHLPET